MNPLTREWVAKAEHDARQAMETAECVRDVVRASLGLGS